MKSKIVIESDSGKIVQSKNCSTVLFHSHRLFELAFSANILLVACAPIFFMISC